MTKLNTSAIEIKPQSQKRLKKRRDASIWTRAGADVAGGYCPIAIGPLCLIWWLYRHSAVRMTDLRVWFACQELRHTRRALGHSELVCFRPHELIRYLGGQANLYEVNRSLNRLRRVGAIVFDEQHIGFAQTIDELDRDTLAAVFRKMEKELDPDTYWSMVWQFTKRPARVVPVMRRLVRFIAGGGHGSARAQVATLIGHTICAAWLRPGGTVDPEGRCTARLIADAFGVNVDRVHRERRRAVDVLGYLIALPVQHWDRQRWGFRYLINLDWTACTADAPAVAGETGERPVMHDLRNCGKAQGPPSRNRGDAPGPDSDQTPSQGRVTNTINPAARGRDGVSASTGRGGEEQPSIDRITITDLRDDARLEAIYRQAVARRFVPDDSDRCRIEVWALAERSLMHGSDPPALFRALLSRGLFHFITLDQEDAGARRVKRHRYGVRREYRPPCLSDPSPPPHLSGDPAILAHVAQITRQTIGGAVLFNLIKSLGWSRERYERAARDHAAFYRLRN